jgi:hypothetical protein
MEPQAYAEAETKLDEVLSMDCVGLESVKVSLQTPAGVSRRPIFSTVVR